MKPIDYKDLGNLIEVRIELGEGKEAYGLFTDLRVKRDTLPENVFAYDIRHDDDSLGIPCEIQKFVLVNHYGCILTNKEIDLGEEGYITFDDVDFILNGLINVDSKYIVKWFNSMEDNSNE